MPTGDNVFACGGVPRTAVLLLNMGGPESIEGVRPFLRNLFADPAIIGLPAIVRLPLAGILSRQRARKVIPRYRLIGGRSPMGEITARQAQGLSVSLRRRGSLDGPVLHGFSYSSPFIAESVKSAAGSGATRLLALSLYPQYCRATTGSCLDDLDAALKGTLLQGGTTIVDSWHSHPGYLDALAGTVSETLERLPAGLRDSAVVIFSAHGVPAGLIRKGDPYLEQTRQTVAGVVKRLGGRRHVLAFQSRLGPVKWLEPSLTEVLGSLAKTGAPPVVVVPVSFISDHVETLYELDIQHREIARNLGITVYERAPALNTRPDFIEALADLVADHLPQA